MCDQRLKVNFVEKKSSFPSSAALGGKSSRRQETQARMERLWHQDVQQFNPERDCMQRQRVQRTIEALRTRTSLTGLKAVDLGCGGGVISRLLRDGGAAIDAVDVATNALQLLKSADMQHITPIHDCLPNTRLADNAYDLVVCTEVIGYLPADEYRLLFCRACAPGQSRRPGGLFYRLGYRYRRCARTLCGAWRDGIHHRPVGAELSPPLHPAFALVGGAGGLCQSQPKPRCAPTGAGQARIFQPLLV